MKHERAARAVEALSEMRTQQTGGGWGWSGMSLPDDMSKIGRTASIDGMVASSVYTEATSVLEAQSVLAPAEGAHGPGRRPRFSRER